MEQTLKPTWLPTSHLSDSQVHWIRSFLKTKTVFHLYFQCALDALASGLDNRRFYLGKDRAGLMMAIQFDGVTIATTVGRLQDEELSLMLETREQGELHIEPEHVEVLTPLCGARLKKVEQLRYYQLEDPKNCSTDLRCRKLGREDFGEVRDFYMQNYPETVFSSWMLEQPFVGLYERGLLTATGGTIILNGDLRTCNIGNFLTASTARGRGLAKIVAKHLIVLLQEEGIKIFTLGTTEENIPAWRAYEAIGFRIQETRPQFDLYPKGGAI